MDEEASQRIGEALYVGEILVDVSEHFAGGYKAETANDGVLGPKELGFEVSVTAYDLDHDDNEREAADMVRELIDRMRYALARCFIFGRIVLMSDGRIDDEDWEVVKRVRDELPEGYLEITPALAAEACLRQEARDDAMRAGVEKMVEFMEAQQERSDENITLGDAVERHKKRTDEVRKIVEGEETAADE